jgi:hypothetical protein
LNDLVFPCVRKRKKLGKIYPKIVKMGAKPIKNEAWGTPCGAGEVKAAAGGKGTKKLHIFDAHRVAFGAFSVPPMPKRAPFWTPQDFEGVPKWSNFVQNQHKV